MRNVPDKSCRENQDAHFVFNNFLFPENCAIYEIIWKNVVDRPQMAIRRMRLACWISGNTDTHSTYEILIPFPLQQWLHERAIMLCLYIQCLSFFLNNQPDAPIIQIYSVIKLMFRASSLPIIRSFLLYIRHW
jgi:hypothetical protein